MAKSGLASVFRGKAATGGINERELKNRGGGGNRDPHLVRFKDGESIPLQFFGNPRDKEHFREFDQHSRNVGRFWEFVPCLGNDDCLPCQSEDEKFANPGYAFAAQVWNYKEKKAMVLSGGSLLAQRIVFKYKQGPTRFTKKVWNLTRLATQPKSYDMDTAEERPINLSNKEPVDIPEYLAGRYQAWADAHKSEFSNRSTLEEDDDDDYEDDEDEMEEEEAPTHRQMMKMDWSELKRYAKSVGVRERITKRSELIDAIEEALDE